MPIREYIHIEPGQENQAIAGYYEVEKELLIPFKDGEVLCTLGYVCWDHSCCGGRGCRYGNVPGYMLAFKEDTDKKGRPVSKVRRITERKEQKEIKDVLMKMIGCLQIIDF